MGTTDNRFYFPAGPAADYYAASYRWTPGTGPGSLWVLYDALPYMAQADAHVTNGVLQVIKSIDQDLGTQLRREMQGTFSQWYAMHKAAAQVSNGFVSAFRRVMAPEVARRESRNGHVSDVGVRV